MPASTALYPGAVVRVDDMVIKFADKFASFRGYIARIRTIPAGTTKEEADALLNDLPEDLAGHFKWKFHDADKCFLLAVYHCGVGSLSGYDHNVGSISCHEKGRIGPTSITSMSYEMAALAEVGDPERSTTYHLGLAFEEDWRYRNGMKGISFDRLAAWVMANRTQNPHFRPNSADEDYQPYLLNASTPPEAYDAATLLQAVRDAVATQGAPREGVDEYQALPGDQGHVLIKVRYGHVYARIEHKDFQWSPGPDKNPNILIVRSLVPESLAESLIGKQITAVVDHPLLAHSGETRVTGYFYRQGATHFETDHATREEVLMMPWIMTPTIS
jgi:hypothetical protein